MDAGTLKVLATREFRDSLRTRWFLLYTAAFTALSSGLAFLATGSASYGTLSGYGRTTAGLMNLVLLVVPLMGLTAGAQSLAGERERGTLAYLLAQPVTRAEVFVGKFAGLALALTVSLAASFGLTGLLLSGQGLPLAPDTYGAFAALTALLALTSLGLGCLVSACTSRQAAALGATVFLWLSLVFLGDLGLMGMAVVTKLGVRPLFWLSLLNPLQVFKLASVAVLQPSLAVLGPVGRYAVDTLGSGLAALYVGLLLVWALGPGGIALWVFVRRDAI